MRVIRGFDLAGAAILPGAGKTPGDNAGGVAAGTVFIRSTRSQIGQIWKFRLTSGRFELLGLQRLLHLLAQLIEHLGLGQRRRLSRVAVSCGLGQPNRRIGVATRWRLAAIRG